MKPLIWRLGTSLLFGLHDGLSLPPTPFKHKGAPTFTLKCSLKLKLRCEMWCVERSSNHRAHACRWSLSLLVPLHKPSHGFYLSSEKVGTSVSPDTQVEPLSPLTSSLLVVAKMATWAWMQMKASCCRNGKCVLSSLKMRIKIWRSLIIYICLFFPHILARLFRGKKLLS